MCHKGFYMSWHQGGFGQRVLDRLHQVMEECGGPQHVHITITGCRVLVVTHDDTCCAKTCFSTPIQVTRLVPPWPCCVHGTYTTPLAHASTLNATRLGPHMSATWHSRATLSTVCRYEICGIVKKKSSQPSSTFTILFYAGLSQHHQRPRRSGSQW